MCYLEWVSKLPTGVTISFAECEYPISLQTSLVKYLLKDLF